MNFGHIHFWGARWFGSKLSGGKRWRDSQQKQLKIGHPKRKLHLPTIDFQGLLLSVSGRVDVIVFPTKISSEKKLTPSPKNEASNRNLLLQGSISRSQLALKQSKIPHVQ